MSKQSTGKKDAVKKSKDGVFDKMKMKDANELYDAVNAMLNLKKSIFEFNHALREVKKKIKERCEEYKEDLSILQFERIDIQLQYCDKNAEGNPVVLGGMYQGIAKGVQPDCDEKLLAIRDKEKKLKKATINFSLLQLRSEGIKISKAHIIKMLENGMTGEQQYQIYDLID